MRGDGGFALPFALMTMLVTGGLATSAIAYSSWNYGSSKRSDADSQALALAEAGLNYAFSTLYNSGTPTMGNAVPSRTITLTTGDASYYGTLTGSTWKLVGIGTVRNPTGPGSEPVVRTVSGRASVGSARRGTDNNAVWNYVYVDDPTFTTSLGNSVDVNIPLYTRGNLRLSNSAQVSAYALQVMGTLELNNTAHVGDLRRSGARGARRRRLPARQQRLLHEAVRSRAARPRDDLRLDDDQLLEAARRPERVVLQLRAGPAPSLHERQLPRRLRQRLDPEQQPRHGQPDARAPLTTAASTTPPVRSSARSPGTRRTQALTLAGTIYFDGPITFNGNTRAIYPGRATIYAAGDITFANQTTVCGDPECDADWNPQQNLLAFVSGGNITIGNLTGFQGAMYAVNDYTESNNSTVWGPIIARRVSLANSSVNHYVPIGTLMPGMPASYEDVVTITNEPGSWG